MDMYNRIKNACEEIESKTSEAHELAKLVDPISKSLSDKILLKGFPKTIYVSEVFYDSMDKIFEFVVCSKILSESEIIFSWDKPFHHNRFNATAIDINHPTRIYGCFDFNRLMS